MDPAEMTFQASMEEFRFVTGLIPLYRRIQTVARHGPPHLLLAKRWGKTPERLLGVDVRSGHAPGEAPGARPTEGPLTRALLASLTLGGFLAGCGPEELPPDPPQPGVALEVTVSDSGSTKRAALSHSLAEIADRQVDHRVIRPDLSVGATDEGDGIWFSQLADVESLGNGRFAIVDHGEDHILVIDSAGSQSQRIGRSGDGPGEFRRPWALERVGDHVVVREAEQARAFTIFGPDWRVAATASGSPDGGWSQPMYRLPRFDFAGFQMGPEDVTRLIRAFDSTTYIHQLEGYQFGDWNYANPIEHEAISSVLVRYDLHGSVVDTLAELRGAPTLVHDVWPGRSIFYTQPLYSARPLFATGDGWYALGHGDSTEVRVYGANGEPLLEIEVGRTRRASTPEDLRHGANWLMVNTMLTEPGAMKRVLDKSDAEREGAHARITARYRWADSIPYVSALNGVGRCLFLSGFSPSDWYDGTSLTWTVIDVNTGKLVDNIRFQPNGRGTAPRLPEYSELGAAMRDVDSRFAFLYRLAEDGTQRVERFPLDLDCG